MRLFAPVLPLSFLGLALALGCCEGPGPDDALRPALQPVGRPGFALNGSVSGAAGEVHLTGGGSYDPTTASNTLGTETSVAAAGGFECITTFVQGLPGWQSGAGGGGEREQLLGWSPC